MGETIINGIIEVSQEVDGQLQYDTGVKGDTGDSDVYHAGQLNVIENTSTLKKSVSGSAILIDDVSPVTHDMSVKISSIPNKNLLNRLIAKAYSSDMSVPTEDFINTYCSKKISFKQGTTYTFSIKSVSGFSDNVAWAPRFYIFDNGSLFVSNTPSVSAPVTFSTDFFTSDSNANKYVCQNGSALWSKANMITNQGPWSMTITPVKDFEAVFIVTDGNVTDSIIVTEAQIEVGSTVTDYVPYIENPVTDLTAVKVSRYGKNLLNQANPKIGTLGGYSNTYVRNLEDDTWYCGLALSGYYMPSNLIDYSINENYITVKTKPSESNSLYGLTKALKCKPNTKYTLSYTMENGKTENASGIGFYGADKKFISFVYCDSGSSFTTPSNCYWIIVCFHGNTEGTYVTYSNIQLELGTTATDYEPYVTSTEYTPNADGTVEGVISLYPSATLTTDTEGVIIDCEYYKDIDADDVIERTVITYTNPKVKVIGDYAFDGCTSLTTINFPVATSIGSSAFYNCLALTTADFPAARSIGNGAFRGCTSLTTINFPIARSIRNSAFYGCTSLTTINFPVATSVEGSAFYNCLALTTADFPVATSIGTSAFRNCKSLISSDFPIAKNIGSSAFYNCLALTTADFPVATSIEGSAFYGCTSLITINFPAARSIGNGAFHGCISLTTINFPVATSVESNAFYNCKSLISSDFPIATSIGNSAFYNCSALTALILRNSTMCTLRNKNAFTGCTKITGTGGYIYVPSSLINTYKTATNWVTYASKFRALEDYTVDGTTTGALDESKVSA